MGVLEHFELQLHALWYVAWVPRLTAFASCLHALYSSRVSGWQG